MSKHIEQKDFLTASEAQFDVLFLGDMTRPGDGGLRLRQDILTCGEIGLTSAVMHLPVAGTKPRVSNDLQRCVREGGTTTVLPPHGIHTHVRLAVVQSPPGNLSAPGGDALEGGVTADKVVLVVDRVPSAEQMGHWFHFAIGPMVWAPPTNRWVRAGLAQMGMSVPMTAADWRPAARPLEFARPPERQLDERLVIGRISAPGAAQWPKTAEGGVRTAYPFDETVDFHVLGGLPKALKDKISATKAWIEHAPPANVTVERFLEPLDVVHYFPPGTTLPDIPPEMPEAAIATAMASGKIVVLPPYLRPHFGDGALYAEPEGAFAAITDLFEDPETLADASGRSTSRKLPVFNQGQGRTDP